MPDLLEELEELTREHDNSLRRASRKLNGEPEGFLVAAREVCRFVGVLSDLWAVTGVLLRKVGLPGQRLLRACDMILKMGEARANDFGLIAKEWDKMKIPAEMAKPILDEVQAARKRLDALMEEVRKTREWAAASPHPPDIFPGLELDKISQAIRDLDAGKGRPLNDLIADLGE